MADEYLSAALERLKDRSGIKDFEAQLMAPAVAEALGSFCRQDGEFAQAVAQGGSFAECMAAVAKGAGRHLPDIDAYKKAVQFYFKGADVRFSMTVELCPGEPEGGEPAGLVLDLEDFL